MFYCEFCEIFKNTVLMELLRWLLLSICTTRCISMIACEKCSFVVINCLYPLTNHVPHYIETSELICIANRLTGFYMMGKINHQWVNYLLKYCIVGKLLMHSGDVTGKVAAIFSRTERFGCLFPYRCFDDVYNIFDREFLWHSGYFCFQNKKFVVAVMFGIRNNNLDVYDN